jgi:hypothetical protein
MTDSRWTPSPDEEELRAPELPPTPKLPEPPQVQFERPKLPGAEPSPTFQRNTRAISLAFSIGFSLVGPVILGALAGLLARRAVRHFAHLDDDSHDSGHGRGAGADDSRRE